MTRRTRFTAPVAAAALVAGMIGLGVAQAGSASAGAPALMQLKGDVLPHLSTYTKVGSAAAGKQIQVDVTIARPHPAAEQQFYNAVYTKGSSSYHHFLTPGQFDARFGVPAADFRSVRQFATGHGLSVADATGSRDLLVVGGSVKQVENTFHVTINNYAGGGKHFYANTAGPLVPEGLGITGVIGLNSALGMHLFHNGPDNPVPASATHGTKPAQDTCETSTYCVGLTTPQDLWGIYDQPGGSKAKPIGNKRTDFGQGQQMAVFGEGQTAPVIANLRTFERLHKLPRVPVDVIHTDGKKVKYNDNSGEVEWDLDTQASTGMSPNVLDEKLYFGHDLSDQSVLNVFNRWADDPKGPLQANASYGECEENPAGDGIGSTPAAFSAGAEYTLASENALIKANMEGRTLFSSAGDTGSSCPAVPAATLNGVTNSVVPIPNYPASSPHAVDVGGTVLYGNGSDAARRQLEYTWTYTGGGTDFIFTKPRYQDNIANIAGICDYTPGGGYTHAGQDCEGTPDVAAQSGDVATNGYGIVAEGETDYPGGGTSLSSPLWMGMWTRIQASAPKAKNGTYPGDGYANPALYGQYKSSRSSKEFFDIGGSTTKSPPASNGFYESTPGWDYTSGMGAPLVDDLAIGINGTERPARHILPKQPSAGSATRSKPCDPLFTDAAGDDSYPAGASSGNNPQLDILAGNMSITSNLKTLKVYTTIKNLSTSSANPAGGGNEYYLLWTYKGTNYFANAEVDSTGAVTYHDGVVAGNQYTNSNTDTGKFVTGKNGTVEVNVPLAHVGTPPKGAHLTAPGAQTRVLVGTSQTGGLIETADTGGPKYDYVVGQRCAKLG
jgi:subtilase family serine protease